MEKNTIRAMLAMITSKMLGITLTSFVVQEITHMLRRWYEDPVWLDEDACAKGVRYLANDDLFNRLRNGRVIRNMGTEEALVYIEKGDSLEQLNPQTLGALYGTRTFLLPISLREECALMTNHQLLLSEKMLMLYFYQHDDDGGDDVSATAHVFPNQERVSNLISLLVSQSHSPLVRIGNLLDRCSAMTVFDKVIFAACVTHEYMRYASGKDLVEPDYSDMTLSRIEHRLFGFKKDARYRRVIGTLTAHVPKRHHKLTGAA